MAIAVHVVNTAKGDAAEVYHQAWQRLREQSADHPAGRQSHTAWMVGDVLHVLDVWDSQSDLDAFMQTLGPILDEFGMALAGPPEIGELVNVVRPD